MPPQLDKGRLPLSRQTRRNQWNVGAPGRESVPRASGPVRGTESQRFPFAERFALERIDAHRLEWLAGTLALPWPEFALGSFLVF